MPKPICLTIIAAAKSNIIATGHVEGGGTASCNLTTLYGPGYEGKSFLVTVIASALGLSNPQLIIDRVQMDQEEPTVTIE